MAVEVVDPDKRPALGRGQRLRGRDADEQRPDQPGPAGDRERVDLVEGRAGVSERRVDDGVDQLEVVARGDLGHDPTEPLVGARLRRDHVRSDRRPVDDRRAGVVARRLDRQDHAVAGSGSSHITSASSPLSW